MANDTNQNETNKPVDLADTQRVKVLSPGMLVAKRFFRNRLAIVGLVIIICMFLFAFLGGALISYKESQVFYTTESMKKDYAGATQISEFLMYPMENAEVPKDAASKLILAISKNKGVVETRSGMKIGIRKLDEDAYVLYSVEETKNPKALKSEEYKIAVTKNDHFFTYNGTDFIFDKGSVKDDLYKATELAVMCKDSFTTVKKEDTLSYEFHKNVLIAMVSGENKFLADGAEYTIESDEEGSAMVFLNGAEYAFVSDMNINSVVSDITLTPDFKMAVISAITEDASEFEFAEDGAEAETYYMLKKNGQYEIKRLQETRVLDVYAKPSAAHPLGTDANGMDMLTRLMYGGRISLLIGFVVIFIEVLIGVIVGGVSGFFGGWVDNLIMRFVDIIYCIPTMPLYLILGSVMDHYKASPTTRIYMLCVVMSIIGWVGIARIVRGQILSLREQEFMVAAEATGISIRRRIFKHLVPNVIPQLIVFATMGLGDVILAEATLSFLGLGIKYPAASWGSIINAVNDSYVMTNYLFVWVPAGLLILLTVLAFNFIGDGLRDAFDPKMKR